MKTINELLIEIKEDKTDNLSTTSFQFKKDLWEFFIDFKDKSVVEFGTHKGQTTRILSFLFKQVYTINCNDNELAKELNKDRTNIEYINFDLYSNNQLIIKDNISAFLIDAGHEYHQVITDINRATSMNCTDECYIIFDDYGCNVHKDGVKAAVDEATKENIISVVKGIGHKAGYNFGTGGKTGPDRILEDFEGLITKINWN
jgi:predicted rRNA methylase YqxC with S4 and FtsJ domains